MTRSRPEYGNRLPRFLLLAGGLIATAVAYELLSRRLGGPPYAAHRHSLLLARGIVIALLLGTAVLTDQRERLWDLTPRLDPEGVLDREERRRQYADWFVHLRWVAAALALGLITIAGPSTRPRLLGWWLALVAANLLLGRASRRLRHFEAQIVVQALVDLVILTGFLNASGGLENPLFTVYLVHVIVGRLLLPPRSALAVTLLVAASFSFLVVGEYLHWLPHYTNFFFPHPHETGAHDLLTGHTSPGAPVEHASYDPFFVAGRSVPFLGVVFLIDLFLAKIMSRLRHSEDRLAATAERAVLERRRLEGVVDASRIGMMQLGPDTDLRWFSGRVREWFGWSDGELGARCPLLGTEGGCQECVVQTASRLGRPAEAQRSGSRPEGQLRHFRHSASPVRDDRGRVVQVVEVIEDITRRRQLEAETIRAGKLSVLGRMAAGIAHEIGNPLSSIVARLSLLERRRDESFVQQSVVALRGQIERISRIVQGVSHFARVRRKDRSVWSVNDLAEECVTLVGLDPKARGVTILRRLEEPGAQLDGVRDQISQVLVNLLLNAVEATPPGGTVSIESRSREGEVKLMITDTGPGIDEATREHLFEPFFTTKPEGTGLGLSISYGLAAAHGGRIEVEGPPQGGSRFTLVLPCEEPAGVANPGDSR